MLFRHVLRQRGILPRMPILAGMGSDTLTVKKDLHHASRKPYVHMFLNVHVWHAVEHLVRGNMVVVGNGADFPLRQFKFFGRQRQEQMFFFLQKHAHAAAFFFLKRFSVKLLQFPSDCFIQLPKGKELPVSQRRDDPCGDNPDSALDGGLVFWLTHSGRKYCRSIVLSHFLICSVQDNLGLGILNNAGFQVVRNQYPGGSAEKPVSVHMGGDPVLLVSR